MSPHRAIAWLFQATASGIRPGLSRMRRALRRRGDPHSRLRVVHVAGTNGKGSVCAMVERALREAGLRTGLYTSPHLHRFAERIRIDGRPVAARRIARVVGELVGDPVIERLTFFERATLLAFELFAEAAVDVAVLETGLGGRLDATNVVPRPLVTAITRIALDHERWLGHTIGAIAREKAGILKPGVPLVSGVRDPVAARVIERRARALGVPVIVASPRDDDPQPRLPGAHQRDNAAVARAILEVLGIPRKAIARGIRLARWPGRLERIGRRPAVWLDAAHNPDGCKALASFLSTRRRPPRRVLLFGAMADKNVRAMLAELVPHCDQVVYAAPKTPRALSPAQLASVHPGVQARSVGAALRLARRMAGPSGEVVVAGSIFTLAEARAALLGLPASPIVTL
ncbi:MAG: bifunctional folylpolyglutamate synthase/dihydrofolate synthase [Myxococcota bacterium]|nr:bifunctional folylpolyglutamate synthase/dihydrofolate synthase [Myxococcota bacterium]MDW8363089.1 folylpolyglutamate synthase/dihydrofolate synthase family protein [Myxococcales bacterium]